MALTWSATVVSSVWDSEEQRTRRSTVRSSGRERPLLLASHVSRAKRLHPDLGQKRHLKYKIWWKKKERVELNSQVLGFPSITLRQFVLRGQDSELGKFNDRSSYFKNPSDVVIFVV